MQHKHAWMGAGDTSKGHGGLGRVMTFPLRRQPPCHCT
ncbi:hypothetical protein E2C01_069549 [Portunus trituberculatus]|uniref:Uncharacterized protein n=1 Tax=Portunus trituberculatus TaxID=210409 RepID=A0A5B7HZ65_PORTR|nr:hypothetical protein [Portunus trituberculatus]